MNAPLWFSNLLFWSAQIAVLVLAAGLLVRLFRISEPRVLLVIWRVMLLAGLLLPWVQPWHRQPDLRAASTFLDIPVQRSLPGPHPVSHWYLPSLLIVAQILGAVILLGIAFRFVILVLGLLKLRRLRQRSLPIPADSKAVAILEQARASLGARAEFRLSTETESPVMFGFASPVIFLPEKFLYLDEGFQSAIACHELLHTLRHDWIHHLIEETLRSALWFHPAMLWLIARLRLAREQVVDLEVIRLTQARKTYLKALLEFTGVRAAAIPAPPFLIERQFAERVALMLKEIRMSDTRLIASLAAMTCTFAFAVVGTVSVFPLKAAPLPSARNETTQDAQPGASNAIVDASTIWTDKVKEGSMPLQVRGKGTLIRNSGSANMVARISIPEALASGVQPGQGAYFTSRGPAIKGHVSRIESSASDGTRSVEITPDSALPEGLTPDSAIDGTINVGELNHVLYVGRPANASANSQGPLLKIINNGTEAVRVNVKFGRASVSYIQVLEGLQPADTVILSDMSAWDRFDLVQIKH